MSIDDQDGIADELAKSLLAKIEVLPYSTRTDAVTVMFDGNNASACRGMLIKKLARLEPALVEYSVKAPVILASYIAGATKQVEAIRFALGFASSEASPAITAHVSMERLFRMAANEDLDHRGGDLQTQGK